MEPNQNKEMEKESDNWIIGLFYFNKKDPRLFLPKRVKWLGFTINFANPKAVFVVIVLVVAVYIATLLTS